MKNVVLASVLVLSSVSLAAEIDMTLEQLPMHILETAKNALPDATFTAAQLDTDDIIEEGIGAGYEVQGEMNGAAVEVDVRPDGSIEEIEMIIAEADVPAEVMEMFTAKFPGFELNKVELSRRPTRSGFTSVWYEFDGVTTDGEAVDVEINAAATKYLVEPD
jgi:uncharacterized membrane protein YkoI